MDVGVCMATPGEFRTLPTRYRIGFTMYESADPLTKYPEWKHDCDQADMLVVPSAYSKWVFEQFFHRDIVVAPLVVSPTYRLSRQREVSDTFTFVSFGTLSGRKSPLETIRCFQQAFPTERDVRLVLKTRMGVCGYSYHQLPVVDDDRITVISTGQDRQQPNAPDDWSADQIRDWLYGADCMVWLSKGEGYGLPPREAAATGLPLIYADNSGMTDITYGYPVPTHHEEESPIGGKWAVPDWDAAIERMRWVYRNREEAYQKAYDESLVMDHEVGARTLAHLLEDVSGHSVRPPIPPAESIRDIGQHAEFYDRIGELIKGPVLDIGVGEGLAYVALSKRGYDVRGVCEPDRYERVCAAIRKEGIEPRITARPLTDLPRGKYSLCVSQGVLQDLHVPEIRLIVDAALRLAPLAISVPSVHYPTRYSEHAHLGLRRQWEDMLNGYQASLMFYAKKRHILGLVRGRGEYHQAYGVVTQDGVWRAKEGVSD